MTYVFCLTFLRIDIPYNVKQDVSDAEGLSSPAPTSGRLPTRLKIKLKLPTAGPSSVANTPPRARRRAPVIRASDIESEDEDEDDEDDEGGTTRSTSVATTGAGGRALTARQAVLANVVDSSHVVLGMCFAPCLPSPCSSLYLAEPPNPRKKKPLTEIEIALKREETARKRRNLTEKKLEDEKVNHRFGASSNNTDRCTTGRDNQPVAQEAIPRSRQTQRAIDSGGSTRSRRGCRRRRRGGDR